MSPKMRSRALRHVARGFRAWARLPLPDKVTFVRLGTLALAAEVALKFRPLPIVARWFGVTLGDSSSTRPGSGAPVQMMDPLVQEVSRLVQRLFSSWPAEGMCLRHALVLGHELRGFSPTLRIGIAGTGGAPEAHAWIEVAGAVVGRDVMQFTPLRRREGREP